jgi:hypothetical protein
VKPPAHPGLWLVATRELRFFRRDRAGLFLLIAIPLLCFAVLTWAFSVAPAATSWPRTTGIFARRPETRAAISIRVLSASPCTSKGSGRARYQIANPIMAIKTIPVMIVRGLSRGLRWAGGALVSLAVRSSVERGATDGVVSLIVF